MFLSCLANYFFFVFVDVISVFKWLMEREGRVVYAMGGDGYTTSDGKSGR